MAHKTVEDRVQADVEFCGVVGSVAAARGGPHTIAAVSSGMTNPTTTTAGSSATPAHPTAGAAHHS
jgi:hypothetical protein